MSEYGISGADASARAEQDSAAVKRAMGGPSLAEFLLARMAEDEAVAQAANGDRWMAPDVHGPIVVVDDGTRYGGEPVVYDEGYPSDEQAEHIARHDPARVLAECEAKRRIVVRLQLSQMRPPQISDHAAEAILRALALPYAEHPDFDPEWRS